MFYSLIIKIDELIDIFYLIFLLFVLKLKEDLTCNYPSYY